MDNTTKLGAQRYSYLMMAGHICTDMSQGALPAILPFLIAERGIDYASAAGLMFASSFLSSIIQPLLGMMTDRRAMPWLMSLGMLMSGLGIAMIGFLDSYWAIFAVVMFGGLGSALFHPEAGRMANCVAGERKGRGMSIFAAGGNIGFVVGPIIATLAVSAWGLKGIAVIMIPVLVMVAIFLSQQKNLVQFSSALTATERKANADNGQCDDWPAFFKLCVSLFARSIINNGMQTFIPLYWVGVLMQTQELGGLMVTVMAFAATIATFIGGDIADRFGFRKVICIAFGALFPLIILLMLTKRVELATIIVIPLSASIHLGYSPSIALGQKYLPNRLGLASGVTLGLSVSVGGICAPLLGTIGDTYGLPAVMYTIAGVALMGLIASFWIKEPQKSTRGTVCYK